MKTSNNLNCVTCDYADGCHKTLKIGEQKLLAKEQHVYNMPCLCIVQDICRNCRFYLEKRCASWRVMNGKHNATKLTVCPKKKVI